MNTRTKTSQSERQKKLASALRQNLLKRKQQQRERVANSAEMQKDLNDAAVDVNVLGEGLMNDTVD